jgi:Bax protein
MRPSAHRPAIPGLTPLLPPALVCLCLLSTLAVPPKMLVIGSAPSVTPGPLRRYRVHPLPAETARELLGRLAQAWDGAGDGVPAVAPSRFPADLDQLPVTDRKEVFFRSLLPHVLARNDRIAREREQLVALPTDGAALGETAQRFLRDLAARYRLEEEVAEPAAQLQALLGRVDVVPPSIALAQAAIESAWGTSRFTREGNNLFGQWVFDRDRGIAPLERPEDANYSLARFQSLGDAVDAYLRNLNGFSAYREFRRLRRLMRAAGDALDPYRLAAGLVNYSTRRHAYVQEVRSVIRGNDLTRYDHARLAQPGAASLL